MRAGGMRAGGMRAGGMRAGGGGNAGWCGWLPHEGRHVYALREVNAMIELPTAERRQVKRKSVDLDHEERGQL